MANEGKHKKNPILEWLEGEEGTTPTCPRGARVVSSYVKKAKRFLSRFRPSPGLSTQAPKSGQPDPLQFREPGQPPRIEVKHSPATSPEHFRKLERLPNLRAPYNYKK